MIRSLQRTAGRTRVNVLHGNLDRPYQKPVRICFKKPRIAFTLAGKVVSHIPFA